MRAVVQRVSTAFVEVEGRVTGEIRKGVVVFLAIRKGDGETEIHYLAEKILDLRIFPDEKQAMNRSVREAGGEILLVSQFTLYGDCRRGRRPSFDEAEGSERAAQVYQEFGRYLSSLGCPPKEGVFGASMRVHVENDGPVTMLLD